MFPVAEREEVGSVLVRRGVVVRARPLQTFLTRRRVPRTRLLAVLLGQLGRDRVCSVPIRFSPRVS